jgi:hypothetical protein
MFLAVRNVLRLVGLGPRPEAAYVEIAVLRHQLAILRREVNCPRHQPTDRLLLASRPGCCRGNGGRHSWSLPTPCRVPELCHTV